MVHGRRLWQSAAMVLAAGGIVIAFVGCTPAFYRGQADRVAGRIVSSQQPGAIGRSEPFSIESPADTLRKRLLLSQQLPISARASLGSDEMEKPKNWPEKGSGPPPAASQPASLPAGPIRLTLVEALRVAAANNRDYRANKENVFLAALQFDLAAQQFRDTFAGSLDTIVQEDLSGGGKPVAEWANGMDFSWRRKLQSGAVITSRMALDLVQLLSGERSGSKGIFVDASVTVPLLRGSGRDVVTEPMTQAQRNVVYALATLERFKQSLAVQVAGGYLAVLQQQDQIANAEENYRNVVLSTRRANRLADAGRLTSIQVDQARQSELSARDRWVAAQQSYARQLDSFKTTLGLPADSQVELVRDELTNLAEEAKRNLGAAAAIDAEEAASQPASAPATAPADGAARTQAGAATRSAAQPAMEANAPVILVAPSRAGGGRLELDPEEAVRAALAHRLDLRSACGAVADAQRGVVVAADALRAGLTLTVSGQAGGGRGLGASALPDAGLRPDRGTYSAAALLDLPLERTAERNAYRAALIEVEQAVRSLQGLEDTVKLQVRTDLRDLIQARESYHIQVQAVELARRRVTSTQLFLEAGRAQMRDLLDAQDSLLTAQNALSSALVDYRVAELELQRDMGVLIVDEKGTWNEYQPPARR
jgi:outer membrane protein TolC